MSDKTDHPPLPQAFADLGVRPSILKALAEIRFETPSDIQRLLIPPVLAGHDVLGQARTGTGKTAAFGIPLVQKALRGLSFQAIILVPTRELCTQVADEITRFAGHTPIRTASVIGGERISQQMKHLKHGPEILVGTPGRVMDLLDRRIIHFENVRFVVLDEVDRMLDIGFRDDIRQILSEVRRHREREDRRQADEAQTSENGEKAEAKPRRDVAEPLQTVFVSATIEPEIEKLARTYMRNPDKLIAPGADEKPTVEQVEQYYITAEARDKYRALKQLLQLEEPELAIVFTRTKRTADKVATRLNEDGIACREIHGNLHQKKREKVMKNFRSGSVKVLIATDLASRGIDVNDITHIVNYDIPEDPEVYVHRIGRTARMGKKGKAFMFVQRDQGGELTKVESLINMIIPKYELPGFQESPDRFAEKPAAPKPEPEPAESAEAAEPTAPARRRTLGSKIPRRRRRR